MGHSRSDPATYRPEGELDRWLARDPINLLIAAMEAASPDMASRVQEIRDEAARDVTEAKDRALSWPEPNVEDRLKDVFA